MIAEAALADVVTRLRPVVERVEQQRPELGQLTTYELGTALAFQHFADVSVDWAVVEVGLGGRLDATNVLTPAASVLTSISFDHTALLGDTLAAIATEKGGIIKPGVPVVSAAQEPEAAATLAHVAAERGAPLILGGRDFTWEGDHRRFDVRGDGWGYDGLTGSLIGRHQVENAAVAIAVVETLRQTGTLAIPEAALRTGLASVHWPARLEVLQSGPEQATVVCDGAHNGESARCLAEAVQAWLPHRRLFLVLGTSADHDLGAIVTELAALQPALVLATASTHPRACPTAEVAAAVQTVGLPVEDTASVPDALAHALALARPGDLVLVTGSLFVAAEARAAFGRTTIET